LFDAFSLRSVAYYEPSVSIVGCKA